VRIQYLMVNHDGILEINAIRILVRDINKIIHNIKLLLDGHRGGE
jgi:hypothetical protein